MRSFALVVSLIAALALATACGRSAEQAVADDKCSRGISDACLTAASLERDPRKQDACDVASSRS